MKAPFLTQKLQIIDLNVSYPFTVESRFDEFLVFCADGESMMRIAEFKTMSGAKTYMNTIFKKIKESKNENQ